MIVPVTYGPSTKVKAMPHDRALGFGSFRYVQIHAPREVEYDVGRALEKLGHHVMFRTINGGGQGTKVIDPVNLPQTVEIPDPIPPMNFAILNLITMRPTKCGTKDELRNLIADAGGAVNCQAYSWHEEEKRWCPMEVHEL